MYLLKSLLVSFSVACSQMKDSEKQNSLSMLSYTRVVYGFGKF